MIVDAAELQERDSFTGAGWVRAIAPAKVNLHLAIGRKQADGYHQAVSVMHALALHDVVYARLAAFEDGPNADAIARMVGTADVRPPDVDPNQNIAAMAVCAFKRALQQGGMVLPSQQVQLRIEKAIPAQAGLGGGSSDAAAALLCAARLWGISPDDPLLEQAARAIGADTAFFLHGGCAYLDGVGDRFSHALSSRKDPVLIVKPAEGVSTGAAYRAFDEAPMFIDEERAQRVFAQREASGIAPFNNLAAAAESLMPRLSQIRLWLCDQPGVVDALLCGSGSANFAICESSDVARRIAAAAREQGLWARTTAFSSWGATVC